MRIIISPAKKMNVETDLMQARGFPPFMEETEVLKDYIRGLSYTEARRLWGCNDKIAELNYRRFEDMELRRRPTPALLSYEGIQYQYMAPSVFEDSQWEFVQEHLRILSGFYGVVRPLDGVVPYRLEMQAKISLPPHKNLYSYWGDKISREVCRDAGWVLNLASKEYSKCVEDFLEPGLLYITCIFGEKKDGKIVQKGTLAKMARGEMVRFLSREGITEPEGVKKFRGLGFAYSEEDSDGETFTFLKTVEHSGNEEKKDE